MPRHTGQYGLVMRLVTSLQTVFGSKESLRGLAGRPRMDADSMAYADTIAQSGSECDSPRQLDVNRAILKEYRTAETVR